MLKSRNKWYIMISCESFHIYLFKTASICFQSAAPVDWVLDGEYGGARTQAQIGCLREKIRILVDRC